MSSDTNHHWVEMQPFGPETVCIELIRYGRLWHGQAARLKDRNRVDRVNLATAVGMDFEIVRHQVIKSVQQTLKH
jgi:hypothetical protein